MELYFEQENVRLVNRFSSLTQSNAMPPTQALALVKQPVSEPPVAVLPETQPLRYEPLPPLPYVHEDEEDPFKGGSPYQKNYDPNIFAAEEYNQLPDYTEAIMDSPKFDESPILLEKSPVMSPIIPLKSTIPIIKLKVVPKRNVRAKKVVKIKKFEKMNWEQINTYLHGVYPISKPGVLCLDSFNPKTAVIDYEDLIEFDDRNPPGMELLGTWISKLRIALVKTADSDDD